MAHSSPSRSTLVTPVEHRGRTTAQLPPTKDELLANEFNVSAAGTFIDVVEALCLRDLSLGEASAMAIAHDDEADLAAAGTSIVSELLYRFRTTVGTRSAEWWTEVLEGSKALALPVEVALDVLILLAADAGGVSLPEIADIERAHFASAYLQLAAVIVTLIQFHGQQPVRATLAQLRETNVRLGT